MEWTQRKGAEEQIGSERRKMRGNFVTVGAQKGQAWLLLHYTFVNHKMRLKETEEKEEEEEDKKEEEEATWHMGMKKRNEIKMRTGKGRKDSLRDGIYWHVSRSQTH